MVLYAITIPDLIDGMITAETEEERSIWKTLLGKLYFQQAAAFKKESFDVLLEPLPKEIGERIREKMIEIAQSSIVTPAGQVTRTRTPALTVV